MIKTFREIIADQLNTGVEVASAIFRDAVLPVYGVSDIGRPVHIGSCFLLEVGGLRYLVTAAHVADDANESTLCVGRAELLPLDGVFFKTVAPKGVRDDDHYDFAWMEMNDMIFSRLGSVRVIRECDIAEDSADLTGRVYLCLGFPRSKNKKSNPATRRLRARRGKYWSTWKDFPALFAEIGISGEDHIAIERGMQSKESDGKLVNSFGPRGMSGGPLVDLGRMVSMKEIAYGITHLPKLAGVQIEHYETHKAILSVKIGCVVKQIKRAALGNNVAS